MVFRCSLTPYRVAQTIALLPFFHLPRAAAALKINRTNFPATKRERERDREKRENCHKKINHKMR